MLMGLLEEFPTLYGPVVFRGRVLPAVEKFTLETQTFVMQHAAHGAELTLQFRVEDGQLTAVVATDKAIDLYTLRNITERAVRLYVDAYSYAQGESFLAMIESVETALGAREWGAATPAHELAAGEALAVEEIIDLQAGCFPLQNALSDLRQASWSPEDAAFHCSRSIEAIRQHFVLAEDQGETSLSWGRMRSALRFERSWVDWLARGVVVQSRHGDLSNVASVRNDKALLCAWWIVHRFCLFLRDGRLDDEADVLEDFDA